MSEESKIRVIKFYSNAKTPYRVFSNFYPSQVTVDSKTYPTVEHYFQSCKFNDEKHKEKIRTAATPARAKELGRTRATPLRDDWEEIKVDVLYEGLLAKFTQHEDLKKILLDTGNAHLVEDSPTDAFWGCGRSGKGKNVLGFLLMAVRDEI